MAFLFIFVLIAFEDISSGRTQAGSTERVSIASDGTQGNFDSFIPSISSDGRYVAFDSWADNLVNNDSNYKRDVFVHDRQTGQTELISVASDGSQGNDVSTFPSISGDGRFVAFISLATNLVSGGTNECLYVQSCPNIFVHDRLTGQTERVSIASDGTPGNNGATYPSISGDGRYIAFLSGSSNLVNNDINQVDDVFVHDRQTGQTELVSIASGGTQANGYSELTAISADGRFVGFSSFASNLVSNDSNGMFDVFVHDRQTGQTVLVSVASDGTQGNAPSGGYYSISFSADGRYIAFPSDASNLVMDDTNGFSDVFLHDLLTGQTEIISIGCDGAQSDEASYFTSISSDGRFVAFRSGATNLVCGDIFTYANIIIRDRYTGQNELGSIAYDGTHANESSAVPSISADGRFIAFESGATNLVISDTNQVADIFVHDSLGEPPPTPIEVDLSILDISPIQVVDNVDLVIGKPLVIRVTVGTSGFPYDPDTQNMPITTTVNFQGTVSSKVVLLKDLIDPVDFFWTGVGDIGLSPVTAEVDPDNLIQEINENNNSMSISTGVRDTKGLSVIYVKVECFGALENYYNTANYGSQFLLAQFPISPLEFDSQAFPETITQCGNSYKDDFAILQRVGRKLNRSADHIVGIVNQAWFNNRGFPTYAGLTNKCGGNLHFVLDGRWDVIPHEIAHTYNLGDSYEGGMPCRIDGTSGPEQGYWVEQRLPIDVPWSMMQAGAPSNFPYSLTWIGVNDYQTIFTKLKSR